MGYARKQDPMNLSKLHRLRTMTIVGREEGDEPYEVDDKGEILVEDGEKVLKEGWEYDDDGKPVKSDDGSDEGGDDDEDAKDDQAKKLKDLEEALRKERGLRRKAERDAKRNARKQSTEKKTELEGEAQKQLEEASAKTRRLAVKLRDDKVEAAILREARKQGFIDETDALTRDVIDAVDVDQDEDDPSEIDIDSDSVVDAVKDLATRKKHLVGDGIPGERSGGKFKKGKGKAKENDEKSLQTHYPSLR